MTEFDGDPVIARAIDELKTLPSVDARMIQGVVRAAADARVSAAEDDVRDTRRVGRLGAPGRHGYAFIVDAALTQEPRRPRAKDPVLGVDGSVLMVVP